MLTAQGTSTTAGRPRIAMAPPHGVFEPVVARLAAPVAKRRVDLTRFHGLAACRT
ncbi:MAG: hypothetical protein M3495_20270 [Pseudomonadota bacterium]|nr:hypothetical protein [Pseudomonadota bacterium]